MADGDGITGYSLNDVRKLIEDRSLPEDVLEIFGKITNVVIALSPLAGGLPTSGILWPLLDPKNALIGAAKAAIKQISRSQPRDYLDQVSRFAAANTLLTYTAYLDALRHCEPEMGGPLDFAKKRRDELASWAAESYARSAAKARARKGRGGFPATALVCAVPHPVTPHDPASIEFRRTLYQGMSSNILQRLEGDAYVAEDRWGELPTVLTERVPAQAESLYQAEFLGLAIDHQPFFVWSTLADRAAKDSRLAKLGDDLRAASADDQLRFELIGAAVHNLDLGLDRLSRAIAAQPLSAADAPRRPDSVTDRAAEALRRRYAADVAQPIVDDRYDPPAGRPRLNYPGSAAAYVPQAYRQVRYEVGETHLERDNEWTQLPATNDLGLAITRYLESPYGIESPLLILGHPGSGKSLLTRVYASRLEYPRYTVVRVELRDTDPTVSIQKQVEDQIRKDTGYDVNWADLADNLPLSPPVVILDGYDELLQATGKLFTDYLDQVQRFQRDARIQGRPVRVIITSRITLIDRAIVPPGTTVIRLEPFDEPRQTEWITRWNSGNAVYFREAAVRPFALPANDNLSELAEQPLLLLMLAIFDSVGNALSNRPDLDQTQLYDELLRRFIERELGKGAHGAAFSGLNPAERRPQVERELTRLGVAAIGMFNRQEVKILRDQLDKDLAYFAAERKTTSDLYGQTQSELLLGSFFFIHESRSRLATNGNAEAPGQPATPAAPGPSAFEFLHNTFGEFLAADFILRQVLENAATVRDLTGKPTLEHARQQHLSTLTPYWFAALLYTPLHTRPNILALLRAWSAHRLPGDAIARKDLLSALDDILHAQLRALLTGTEPLDLAARARLVTPSEPTPTVPPYDLLPVLGHLAVYTLNLILLRACLADDAYTLDETALDAGVRPWDRLTALWRSWFPLETLTALSTQFSATRTDDQLALEAAGRPLPGSPHFLLDRSYQVAASLADDLNALSLGLHVASSSPPFPGAYLADMVARHDVADSGLEVIMKLTRARMYDVDRQQLARNGAALVQLTSARSPGWFLELEELADRVLLAPRLQEIPTERRNLSSLSGMSRYEAQLHVSSLNRFDPDWLADPADYYDLVDSSSRKTHLWCPFLREPAAAPVLREAWRQLSPPLCGQLSGSIREGWIKDGVEFYDIDTASALALLAWKGGDAALYRMTFDVVQTECVRGEWSLTDIPLESWAGLADLFTATRPASPGDHQEFADLMDAQLADLLPQGRGVNANEVSLVDLWLHMLRIGSSHRDRLLTSVLSVVPMEYNDSFWAKSRSWFLLFLCWARENNETELLASILSGTNGHDARYWWVTFGAPAPAGPAAINLDAACADLTHRGATDLTWALALWRSSGAHWPGEPTGSAKQDRLNAIRRPPPARRFPSA